MDEHPGRDVARRIGRVGVWMYFDSMPAREARRVVGEIESLGYGAVWSPELVGKEAFTNAALLLAGGERIVVATGIANVYARDPVAAVNASRTLAEAYPDRFVLGLGVSHPYWVGRRGGTYGAPVPTMRAYLDAMAATRYHGPKPKREAPIVLAALGSKMLALAAERTAGAHTYFVPVEHTAEARRSLGPGPLLAVEITVALEPDATAARAAAREFSGPYLSARAPTYAANLKRLGWNDADLADGGSDALVDALVPHGSVDDVTRAVRAHLEAGADHVCVQPIGLARGADPVPALREVSAALLRL